MRLSGIGRVGRLGFDSVVTREEGGQEIASVMEEQDSFSFSYMDAVTDCIKSLMLKFVVCSVRHIHRSGNTVAHLVARIRPPNGVEVILCNRFSSTLHQLVKLDLI